MNKIRTVVVDDEVPARDRLLELLEKQPDVELAGVARNGEEAVQLILSESPDLVFLDVQMPGLDGFGVLREVTPQCTPPTIFVTAYDKYAIQAFEAHALDYLLKPFSDERFEDALQRARDHIRTRAAGELSLRLARLLDDANRPSDASGYHDRIAIKSGTRVIFLEVRDIDWIEAAGVYVYLHVGPKAYLYRATVGQLQERLDPKSFVRIHRSTIINSDRILELKSRTHGDYGIILKDGTELTLSRGFRPQLESWLRHSL
ncbi:MAG TPA: LytTR family DNA-binding domain-containing protein [Bryobacteraceae bacterium]|nr:LytTR family DNA-binding domain-containing protein [Bryobacteraceae bacterium]